MELRKFLGKNENNPEEINKVKNIPMGKWNYLSSSKPYNNKCLSLIRTTSMTKDSKKEVKDLFFVSVKKTSDDEYVAEYIDTTKALDLIKTDENDNVREQDKITLDRVKVSSRSYGEAKRQADNPSNPYKITPMYERALKVLIERDYFNTVQGNYERTFDGHSHTVEFCVDKTAEYKRETWSDDNIEWTDYCYDNTLYSVAEHEKSFIANYEYYGNETLGELDIRDEIIHMKFAHLVVQPFLAAILLEDFDCWEITDTQLILNRECAIIEGYDDSSEFKITVENN